MFGGPAYVCKSLKFFIKKYSYNKNIKVDIKDDEDISSLNKKELLNLISYYDLVSIHGIWSFKNSELAKICRNSAIPYIISLHGMLDPWSWKKNFIFKIIFYIFFLKKDLKFASLIHCLNYDELNLCKKFFSNSHVFIYENLLDLRTYKINKKLIKIKKTGYLDILYFGRITKKKRLENFLYTLQNIKKNFNIRIVGPSNTKEDLNYLIKLKKITHKLGIEDKVKFYDPIKSDHLKSKILNNADLFILPSISEGDSVALKESVLHGLPLLISKYCKFEVSCNNKKFGYYLNDDLSNSKKIIGKLIDMNNKEFVKLKLNAIEFSHKFIVTSDKINKLVEIYEDTIRSKKNSSMIKVD